MLVDVLPLHVAEASLAMPTGGHAGFAGVAVCFVAADGRFEAKLGDARSLEEPDESFDAVLLFGPLYHLTERADRIRALAEGRRVLRPGGVALAAAISRFASLLDGLSEGFLREPAFRDIVERDLREGRHLNPDPAGRPEWFTTAHFHHPDELEQEIAQAGLALEALLGVEGPGWLFPELDSERDLLLFAARATEADPAVRALSAHLLAVARKP